MSHYMDLKSAVCWVTGHNLTGPLGSWVSKCDLVPALIWRELLTFIDNTELLLLHNIYANVITIGNVLNLLYHLHHIYNVMWKSKMFTHVSAFC